MPSSQQRKDAARRRLERQLAARRERETRNKKLTLIMSIAGTLALIIVVIVIIVTTTGSNSSTPPAASSSTPPTTSAPTSPTAAATYPCSWTAQPPAAKKVTKPATTTPPKTGHVTVSVQTTQGPMTFDLNRAGDPCTVASFVSLVQQHYFDHTPCHRLVTAGIYVLQCGDPTGNGTGGPGYSIPDEATGNETYPAGTIAMARTSQPHSGGSQFFIVFKDSPNLMQHLGALQYTVFGKVSKGLDVVLKVAAKGATTGTDGKPKLPISLTSLTVK